jgi:secreted trypsin-like serine protease
MPITCHSASSFSGGPLVLGTGDMFGGMLLPVTQVGIVSHHGPGSASCQDDNYPSVFTRVSDVWGWITDTVFHETGELGPALYLNKLTAECGLQIQPLATTTTTPMTTPLLIQPSATTTITPMTTETEEAKNATRYLRN